MSGFGGKLRIGALVAVVALVAVGGGVLVGRATNRSSHHAAPATTSTPNPTSSTGSVPGPPSSTSLPSPTPTPATDTVGIRQIPVATCPTQYGVSGQTATPIYPSSLPLTTTQAMAGDLSFYTNDVSSVRPVLGPRGWSCQALLAADGSASITIYPVGHAPSSTGAIAGQPEVEASSFGACEGCIYAAVCSLAPKVTAQLGYAGTGLACTPPPAGQTTDWLKGSPDSSTTADPDVIAYANPSSPDPTNGVVLFQYQGAPGPGAQLSDDECVLAAAQHSLCTVILDQFVASDWRMAS